MIHAGREDLTREHWAISISTFAREPSEERVIPVNGVERIIWEMDTHHPNNRFCNLGKFRIVHFVVRQFFGAIKMHVLDVGEMAQLFVKAFKLVAIFATACVVLEVIFPAYRYSFASYIRGARNWIIRIGCGTLIWHFYALGLKWLGVKPLVTINFGALLHSSNPIANTGFAVLSGVLVAIAGDFFYYWMHRAQHAVPFLWRLHATHHSIRELTAWNCNHHISEPFVYAAFVALPLALIHFESGVVPVAAMALITFQAHLSHSSTRFNLGPLRYLIGDNKFHRIHHSTEFHHRHKNYGFFTTVWDTIFRTAYWPKTNEWPEVGMRNQPEPLTVRDFIMFPFDQRRWRKAKAGSGTQGIKTGGLNAVERDGPIHSDRSSAI
ncbi:sterol desaturase family protein [Rhizobium mesoamericanum]|uniref:sterol desaturase family protein n=1 Tax=Rhizobium mesoamericanum TaxID=1079800 RepID=UPI0002D51FAD|nr:sterol desaturase family protein [Rhizobium mesoamericanum]